MMSPGEEERRVAMAKITGQGLRAIAVAVVLLWACIVAEHLIVRAANQEAWRALRDLEAMRLRRHNERVSTPVPHVVRPARPTLG